MLLKGDLNFVKFPIMNRIRQIALALLLILSASQFAGPLYACTSAIITGGLTPDGRPLMWKHRDTDEVNNRIQFFNGEKYSFLALVNSYYADDAQRAWAGNNEAGFCIMNTASYNLSEDDTLASRARSAGRMMYKALSICKNLKDFETMLDTLARPLSGESNYGVIDAEGGAAYYEVNEKGWRKIDVNDPKVAPQGYLVYTNFSYTGRPDDGMGYIRYTTADLIIKNRISKAGEITPKWIFSSLSRSFYHSMLGIDLRDDISTVSGNGFFIDQDFIPRKSSTSAIVFHGVKNGENPVETVMWAILGYPPTSVAVPLFIKAGENQPAFMIKNPEIQNNAIMCNLSLALKEKVFPIKRGNGEKYLDFKQLYNDNKTGFIQVLESLENKIIEEEEDFLHTNYGKRYSKKEFDEFYAKIEDLITSTYAPLIQ